MKKLIAIVIVLGVIIAIVRLSSPEDTWLCTDGVWIKHGNPSVPVPTTKCGDPATDLSGKFSVPDGFVMDVYAEGVNDARVMAFDPGGAIIVSQPAEGKISALRDNDGDGIAESVTTVVEGLKRPHGITFRCTDPENPEVCDFYVAEEDALDIFEYDPVEHKASAKKKLLDLPAGGGHFTRSLLFMPSPNENTLLISIGSSCNVCRENDVRRASVISYDIVTGKNEQYATGLRNSVFMGIDIISGAIWATEMGRDMLGDDIPPDEINIIEKGKNYGWPVCYGKNIHDTEFDKNTYVRNPCQEPLETASFIDVPAHSAPLGLAFIPEEGWPEEYWYDLVVAYHGSWNRSVPTGYKIVRHKLNAKGEYEGVEDFITGWMDKDGKVISRPVDIIALSGGTMYISDDEAGKVYRVRRVRE